MATVAKKWTEEQKFAALTIAESSTCSDASEQTGIPTGTIKRWRMEIRGNEPTEPEPNEPPIRIKKVQQAAQEMVDQATVKSQEIIEALLIDKSEELANRILDVARLAADKMEWSLNVGPNETEPMAGWLKAAAGAMHLAIDKAQLLTGKPTSRSEIKGELQMKEEHTQRIVHELLQDPAIENRWLMAVERAKLPKVGDPME